MAKSGFSYSSGGQKSQTVSGALHQDGGMAGSFWRLQGRIRSFALMVEIFVSPSNLYIEILTPNVMALGGGTFGRSLNHEDGALVNGISDLKKEAPECSLALSAMCGH